MSGIRSYQDLQVWARSLEWAEKIYRVSSRRPSDERFGLISQVRRAAVSVAANISEGAGRRTTGEFLQLLGIAKGSLSEAETLVLLAGRLSYVAEAEVTQLLSDADQIGRMLSGLTASLEARREHR